MTRLVRSPGVTAALAALGGRGGARKLAKALGISDASVSEWSEIPLERVPEVEAATGVDRAVLRPDYWRPYWRPTNPDPPA